MTSRACVLLAVLVSGSVVLAWKADPPLTDLRSQAQKEFKAGNFKDAWGLYQKLALDPQDDRTLVAGDFKQAIQSLRRLGREAEIDAFRDRVVDAHQKNWRLLRAAARSFLDGPQYGFIIGGQFVRGHQHRGGESVIAAEPDRARALKLMQQALPFVGDDPEREAVAAFYLDFANMIMSGRFGRAAWELQSLTDLSKLPDYSATDGYDGTSVGAPVDADGNAVFYRVPAGYDAAKSDGERWRWALAQVGTASPAVKDRAALALADFLHQQFGVQTLRDFRRLFDRGDKTADEANGPYALATLKDDETIARLATGVKRFKLSDEFNFLRIYREVATAGQKVDAQRALTTLAGIYQNRRQYPRAAELWRECIRRFGPGQRGEHQQRLEQIVGNWGRFEPTGSMPATAGRTLGFRFRNGTQLQLEAHALRVEKLLEDVKTYLKTGHPSFQWDEINVANIGYRLVVQNQSQYLGERVAEWKVTLQPPPDHVDGRIEVAVPVQKAGAYLVTAKMAGGNTSRIVLWLADTVLLQKHTAHGALYLVADAVTGKPVAGANVEFFGYTPLPAPRGRVRVGTLDFAETTGDDGLAVPDPDDLHKDHQWLVMARGAGGRLAFLGFENIWWSDSQDEDDVYSQNKAFAITDRPVYRPGQTMKFKFWVGQARYDAAPASPFAGRKFKIRLGNPRGETVFKKTFTADSYGGFDGEFSLPSDAALGSYGFSVMDPKNIEGAASFRVEEYKKPEFEVKVEAPSEPVRLGEKITATIRANYYFGGPVTEARVHYTVTRTAMTALWYPPGTWDWLFGPGYWWFWPDSTWFPGWTHWGCLRPDPFIGASAGPREVVLDANTPIGPDGTVKVAIDTTLAKTLHGDSDHRYAITAEIVDQSRRTIVGSGEVLVARQPFQIFSWTDHGYYQVGDAIHATFQAQTLDHKPVHGKGVATLYRVTYEAGGKPVETSAQTWDIATDERGRASLELKASEAGQYRLSYKLTDGKNQTIEGGLLFTVRGAGFDGSQFRFNDLELITDKREYAPGEKVRLLVNTNRLDGTVFLFVRAISNIYPRPQVVRLKGKSTLVEIAVTQSDMPNFFVEALTVSNGQIFVENRQIVVPPEKRVVNVAVKPSAQDYKPGTKAGVKLQLTDLAGKPVVGSVVLAVYDKSVEYISGGTNIPEIREFFWNWRRTHYPQTESSLASYSEDILKRDEVPMNTIGIFGGLLPGAGEGEFGRWGEKRQKAGVMSGGFGSPVFAASKSPGLIANEGAALRRIDADRWVTPIGGTPIGLPGPPHLANAAGAPTEVQPTLRTQFADTAYWAARLEANKDGMVDVSFPLPENLTTWKIRGWALAPGVRVGQGEAEIVTTKNLLLRMQAPRFFVEQDEVVLSANVHNRLKTAKSVHVVLALEGKSLVPFGETSRTVEIAAGGEARVDWRVKAVEHGEAVVRMQALTDEESDAMQMHFPVRVHGMLKTESYAGAIRPDRESSVFEITVPSKRRVADTLLEIRYSPTLAGAMVDALPYLVSYPHDTTDCTLYRFLPTVITQNILKRMHLDLAAIQQKRTNLNAQELGDPAKRAAGWKRFKDNPVFDNAAVTRMVKKGVTALTNMQLADGGWGWFSGWGEHSEPHMTAQVVHGLELAKQNGAALVPGVLERGIEWLKQYQAQQVVRLKHGKLEKPVDPYKTHADNLDALVYFVLVESKVNDQEMQDFLYRDRTEISVYAKGLVGLALSELKVADRLAMIVRNIDQFLVQDDENQTAWLKLPAGSFWWFWYDSETEANAYYLKLLARTDPQGQKASRLAKYLLNNRKHATYWNSPRDTAIAIEALAEYVVASGEDRPQLTVEVLVDGKKIKAATIDAQNLFTFDDEASLAGAALEAGVHKIELRKRGKGPLYFNAYLTNFTQEDFITHAGLEIKVARSYFKLIRSDETTNVVGSRGQVVGQRTENYRRVALANFGEVKSGDLLEIELTIDSKNDYEHLIFEDPKAAGAEPFDVQSGYNAVGLPAYVELRDEKVTLFVRTLPHGKHSLHYRMRAEIPGKFSALPTVGTGMYAPELKGNSDEMKLTIGE
jgi:alpha-2-macroglobulin